MMLAFFISYVKTSPKQPLFSNPNTALQKFMKFFLLEVNCTDEGLLRGH